MGKGAFLRDPIGFRVKMGITMHKETPSFQQYRLTRITTESATGYFDCTPVDAPDFDAALALSRQRPNDEFMRKHLMRLIGQWTPADLKQAIFQAPQDDVFLQALFFEVCLLMSQFATLRKHFPVRRQKVLAESSPLVFIKSHLLSDQRLHRRWIQRLQPNFSTHADLPPSDEKQLPPPVHQEAVARAMSVVQPLDRLVHDLSYSSCKPANPLEPEALTALALDRLSQAGVHIGPEMRHESSLSPIALLREWQLDVSVDCHRHQYRLQGEQISYGRGLELDHARVACTMEIVERVCSYATITHDRVQGYHTDYPVIRAPLSDMRRHDRLALDPNRIGLEVPYRDAPLHWIQGCTADAAGADPIWVPAQCVFLFCNLDETKLFSGLGSNGLGAGATMAQAKCQALLELIERDCAATIPHTPALRFDIETDDARIGRLLQNYAAVDIQVGFVDITGPLGVPCCKSFVMGADGQMVMGSGAHLDARRALLSALTETPYPFPYGPPSQPLQPAKVRVPLEALPSYDQGDAQRNLQLLERLLLVNGFEPIYVNLTRADLDLPVVRAIVPGMEILGDFDRCSRVHPRLYGHYLKYAPGV